MVVAVSAILCLLANLWNIGNFVIRYRFFNLFQFFSIVPFLCILTYFITLKHDYKLKKFLFPSAFLIIFILSVYQFITSYAYVLNMDLFSEMSIAKYRFIFNTVIMILIDCILFLSYALCFIGSVANFKMLTLFKVGTILRVVLLIVIILIEILAAVLGGIETHNEGGQLMISYQALAERLTSLIFGVSLLLLAFNKRQLSEEKGEI